MFFKNIDSIPVLLVEASIHSRMKLSHIQDYISKLRYSEFRIIFWAAPSNLSEKFKNGVWVVQQTVDTECLEFFFSSAFDAVRPEIGVMPHVGLGSIPKEWLPAPIYLLTTGRNDDSAELQSTLPEFMDNLHVVFFPHKKKVDSMMNCIDSCNDNDALRRLEVCKGNNRVVYIDRPYYPNHLLPYDGRSFSEYDYLQFRDYIEDLLSDNCQTVTEQLRILEKLRETVKVLTIDKPASRISSIIARWPKFFCLLHEDFVKYTLLEPISQREITDLPLIIKRNAALHDKMEKIKSKVAKDAMKATGNSLTGMTIMIAGKVSTLISESTASILTKIPNPKTCEAIRYWLLNMYSEHYGFNNLDFVMYAVMIHNHVIQNSKEIDPSIAKGYRIWARIMIRKPCRHSTKTEWQRLKQGFLPMASDGKVCKFLIHLEHVRERMNVECESHGFKYWIDLCKSLHPELGLTQQRILQDRL